MQVESSKWLEPFLLSSTLSILEQSEIKFDPQTFKADCGEFRNAYTTSKHIVAWSLERGTKINLFETGFFAGHPKAELNCDVEGMLCIKL